SILYSAINSTLIMSFTINSLIIALYASVQLIERSREIATMKAIGVSKTQLLLLFLSEYATLLIFSTIMGLLSGLFSSWMLMNIITINRSIPPFIMKFPGFYIALVAIILFLTAFIGALIPSLTATNKNIGTDLRQSS
ncbi:MAG: FtsX-like permease family protein, partial [Candidatus Heimdallarchaeaceae archaeon]